MRRLLAWLRRGYWLAAAPTVRSGIIRTADETGDLSAMREFIGRLAADKTIHVGHGRGRPVERHRS